MIFKIDTLGLKGFREFFGQEIAVRYHYDDYGNPLDWIVYSNKEFTPIQKFIIHLDLVMGVTITDIHNIQCPDKDGYMREQFYRSVGEIANQYGVYSVTEGRIE